MREPADDWQPQPENEPPHRAGVKWEGKKGSTNDGDFFLIWTDRHCCRDTTFVMGRYEWDWEGGGRTAQFRNSLNCLPLSLLFTRLAFAGVLSSFSNLNPSFTRIKSKSSLIAGLAATHAAGGAHDPLLSCSSRMASSCK